MTRRKKEIRDEEEVNAENKKEQAEEVLSTRELDEEYMKKINDLESKTEQLEKEKNEMHNKYLRTLAEFENFRRRTAKERVDWIRNANESLILKLCDVVDDFERAIQNQALEEESPDLASGMTAIFRKLQAVLKSENVSKIETEDEDFNPIYHDAVTYAPSNREKDKIVGVIQNGYIINNKVIRPAKVVLSSGERPERSISYNEDEEKK